MDVERVGKVTMTNSRFQWELNNQCIRSCKHEHSIESPSFTIVLHNNKELEWRLRLFTKGSIFTGDMMSIILVSHNKSKVEVRYSIQAFKDNVKIGGPQVFRKRTFHGNDPGDHWFIKKNLNIDEATGNLTTDNLMISCEISLPNLDVINHIHKKRKIETAISHKLKELDRLENLMDDEKFSDVTLVVNGKRFRGHKCILANKSPVFAAMFEHHMKEQVNNTVEIEGIDHQVFKEMLRFMYAGKVDKIENIADHLLAVADKYSIEGLKIMCEETLAENVCAIKAVKYLELADLHNASNLKKQIIDFIVQNAQELLNVPEYKSIVGLPPDVVFEVLNAFTLELKKCKDK